MGGLLCGQEAGTLRILQGPQSVCSLGTLLQGTSLAQAAAGQACARAALWLSAGCAGSSSLPGWSRPCRPRRQASCNCGMFRMRSAHSAC